ncbi:hypothetical protein LBMAG36_09350 [Chlorobiota bacterium]|nr:hypothetical protein LBMAG36_09350 [Chlorobiota bacterium]
MKNISIIALVIAFMVQIGNIQANPGKCKPKCAPKSACAPKSDCAPKHSKKGKKHHKASNPCNPK